MDRPLAVELTKEIFRHLSLDALHKWIQVRPMSSVIGAEIKGVNISADPDQAVIDLIRQAC